MPSPASIEDAKAVLRREALARRDALPRELRAAVAEAIAARPFPAAIKPGAVVSGFMPMKRIRMRYRSRQSMISRSVSTRSRRASRGVVGTSAIS